MTLLDDEQFAIAIHDSRAAHPIRGFFNSRSQILASTSSASALERSAPGKNRSPRGGCFMPHAGSTSSTLLNHREKSRNREKASRTRTRFFDFLSMFHHEHVHVDQCV